MATDSHQGLVVECWRGGQLLSRTEFTEPSVTIGSGSSAMLRLEDLGLAEIHAVVSVEEDGTLLALDVRGEPGLTVRGEAVAASPLGDGDSFGIGDVVFRIARAGTAQAVAHTEAPHAPDDHGYEHEDIADVVSFVMRTAPPTPGEKAKPPVLEVHHMWGNVLLDSQQFAPDVKEVSIGARTGKRWTFLGVDMGWVPGPLALALPFLAPMWSEVESEWKSDFTVPRDILPGEQDWTLFTAGQAEGEYVANIAKGWDGFADIDGKRMSFEQLVAAGKAKTTPEGGYTVPMTRDTRLMVDVGEAIFLGQMASPAPRHSARMSDMDYPFLGLMAFGAFIFTTVAVMMWVNPPTKSNEMLDIPDRFVELLLQKPEEVKDKDKNPDAGERAKAKKEEGKTGKKEAKVEKAKGKKIDVKKMEIDRQVAEDAGVLGAMKDSDLNSVLGSSGLSNELKSGIGGLIGAKGSQFGSGGLGGRGSGLGGGGSAEGLGGLGTKGMGSGASGYGAGGGNFGQKGEGGIGTVGGDPIILGALDRSLIDEVIKRHMNQIRYCYQRELTKNPALAGKIVIKFTIAKDGTVSSSSTKTTTMNNAAVEDCVVGRFMRMQFPQPKGGGIVIVSYPFIFSPG